MIIFLQVSVDAIESFFKLVHGKDEAEEEYFKQLLEEVEGFEAIEQLQYHSYVLLFLFLLKTIILN